MRNNLIVRLSDRFWSDVFEQYEVEHQAKEERLELDESMSHFFLVTIEGTYKDNYDSCGLKNNECHCTIFPLKVERFC